MSGTLDAFFPPTEVKPKLKPKQENIVVQEICSNPQCKRKIPFNEPTYRLRIKGKEGVYCQTCAKKILHPQENTAENLGAMA